jgi:large subunit ribosomal protein L4
MLVDLFSFSQKDKIGSFDLPDEIFALEPRQDIIKLVVDHQRIKKIAGTRSVKNLSEVSGTGKKPFAQKGTGNARRGTNRAPHMRGGAVAHDVSTNSKAHKLNKKVRFLGLSHSLSLKVSQKKLFVVDSLSLDIHKTTNLLEILSKYRNRSNESVLIIDSMKTDANLFHAARNLHNVTTVCRFGANVYDIIKHSSVIICKDAINMIAETSKRG